MRTRIWAVGTLLVAILLGTRPVDSLAQGSVAGDRAALLAFRVATNCNCRWGFGIGPLKNWYGVTTDVHGRVIKLELPVRRFHDPDLTGTLPSELGALDKLRVLNLNGHRLTGRIPLELGRLYSLSVLELSSASSAGRYGLSGTIPPALGNLLSLNTLDLSSNQLARLRLRPTSV